MSMAARIRYLVKTIPVLYKQPDDRVREENAQNGTLLIKPRPHTLFQTEYDINNTQQTIFFIKRSNVGRWSEKSCRSFAFLLAILIRPAARTYRADSGPHNADWMQITLITALLRPFRPHLAEIFFFSDKSIQFLF